MCDIISRLVIMRLIPNMTDVLCTYDHYQLLHITRKYHLSHSSLIHAIPMSLNNNEITKNIIPCMHSTRSRSLSPSKRFRGPANMRDSYHSPPGPRDISRSVTK